MKIHKKSSKQEAVLYQYGDSQRERERERERENGNEFKQRMREQREREIEECKRREIKRERNAKEKK